MKIKMLLAAAGLAFVAAPAAAQNVMTLSIDTLAANVFAVGGFANGNVLILRDGSAALLVDAQSARRAPALDTLLRAHGIERVDHIVNTHYHSDHIGGNGVLRSAGTRVLAHANLAAQASKDTTITERDWDRNPEPPENLPSETFTDSALIRFGGYDVVVRNFGPAHTDGDAYVFIPALDLVHTGDILELNAPPFIDWWSGGTLVGMMAALDRVLALTGPDTRYVPGHGPVADRATAESYRAMVAELDQRSRALAAAGKTQPDDWKDVVAGYESRLGRPNWAAEFAQLLRIGYTR